MIDLQTSVQTEIEEIHQFVVDWFTGRCIEEDLGRRFVDKLDARMTFYSPDGDRHNRETLTQLIEHAYGTNPNFAIEIRDVAILRKSGSQVLVSYTEWQRGAQNAKRPKNARLTSALLTLENPFKWLHMHETWLPEAEQVAGLYDF